MLKILAVGNSFSEDATALIEILTDEIFVRNLFFPACSLKQHCEFYEKGESPYEYQHNGARSIAENISLADALAMEKWDFITIQQVSGSSGIKEDYYPHINKLIGIIRKHSDAKIILHRTWPYEHGADHPDFVKYENSKDKMWQSIKSASGDVAAAENLPVIECGDAVYTLGQNRVFNRENGGITLYRDGYHLSVNYGRLLTASVWIKYFTGKLPAYLEKEGLSAEYQLIKAYLENNHPPHKLS